MGEKKSSKWRHSLAEMLELPQEIILNLPRITLIGNLQCYIENHHGIIEYTTERIRLALNLGELIVSGKDLTIRYLANEEIAIAGTIEKLQYGS
ncbi:MAG: sporulation protein YqfC [Firmicutes bacterium]|nr:sporulation protein YqfC [Bacillota bacterium]